MRPGNTPLCPVTRARWRAWARAPAGVPPRPARRPLCVPVATSVRPSSHTRVVYAFDCAPSRVQAAADSSSGASSAVSQRETDRPAGGSRPASGDPQQRPIILPRPVRPFLRCPIRARPPRGGAPERWCQVCYGRVEPSGVCAQRVCNGRYCSSSPRRDPGRRPEEGPARPLWVGAVRRK